MHKEIEKGRQVYVVYPLVEESENLEDIKAATEMAEQLQQKSFPDQRVGLLHGRMKSAEKQSVMANFKDGKLDILVNYAGISSRSVDDPTSLENWDRIMNINSTGVFLGTKHSVPHMQTNGGGSIVNMSSIMGLVGGESGHPAYNASKGSVRLLTKATAVRYGKDGIRANSVHPGYMPPMLSNIPDDEVRRNRQNLIDSTPLRREGERMEVAKAVLFLASDDASFITGAELAVDGGFTAK